MLTLAAPLRELFAQGGTLLVPSRQRAAAVRLAFASENIRAGRKSWRTPNVLTPIAWLQQQLAVARQQDIAVPRLLRPAEEWCLWRRASESLAQQHSALLATGPLAKSLRSAAQLVATHAISTQNLAAAASFDVEASWLLFAMRAVEQGAAQVQAIALHQALALAPIRQSLTLRTAGLQPLPPAWARLLEQCGALPLQCGDVISEVVTVAAANEETELRLAAHWCQQKLAADPAVRLLVVVPDLSDVRPAVTRIWRDSLCPNAALGSDAQQAAFVLEGGEPLTMYPWIVQALSSLGVLSGCVSVEQATAWLLSPFWQGWPAGLRAVAAAKLRRNHQQHCELRDVLQSLQSNESAANLATPQCQALQRAAAPITAQRRGPGEWASVFAATLASLGCVAAQSDSSLAAQIRSRWQELLEDFAAAGAVAGAMAGTEAVTLLGQLAGQASFASATGDAAVTVTASEEHPIVRYDGIWVCRRTAAQWPAAAAPDAFLPRTLQLAVGVQKASAVGQLVIAQAALLAWQDCTQDLRLSWSQFRDDAAAEPSALLLNFPVSKPLTFADDGLLQLRGAAAPAVVFDDDWGAPWPPAKPLPTGSRSLELQSACAFRAFAELRLGATALELAEPGVDRRDRGKLLHRALELFWRQTQTQLALQQLSAWQLAGRIASCVAQASLWCQRQATDDQGTSERNWSREAARAQRQLERLCEFEKNREPFNVVSIEQQLDTAIGDARLRLRVDRIDDLGEGAAAVIDYKSSDAPQRAQWLDARPGPVQLLTYLSAMPEQLQIPGTPGNLQVAALATLHLGRKSPSFHGVSDHAERLTGVTLVPGSRRWVGVNAAADWSAQLQLWRSRIARLAQDFLDGRAVADPAQPATCRYCELTTLCRRVERVRYDANNADREVPGDSGVGAGAQEVS